MFGLVWGFFMCVFLFETGEIESTVAELLIIINAVS